MIYVDVNEICGVCNALKPTKFAVGKRTPTHYFNSINTLQDVCKECDRRALNEYFGTIDIWALPFPMAEVSHLQKLRGSWKAGARKRGLPWHLTSVDVAKKLVEQEGRCAITGLLMASGHAGRGISVDRINNVLGYFPANVQLVCARINWMKGEMDLEELRLWCAAVVVGQNDEEPAT